MTQTQKQHHTTPQSKTNILILVGIIIIESVTLFTILYIKNSKKHDPTVESPSQSELASEEPKDEFQEWWDEYKEPVDLDTSSYPNFYRGAYASRLDEARNYLLSAEQLRQDGFDTIMMGADIVFDPETGNMKTLGEDLFVFYIQAFKNQGFRVFIAPNGMHPNLDMGEGYEWEEYDPNARYHRSKDLIQKLNPVVLHWAELAEQYETEAFVATIEPIKYVRDYQDASDWLQQILPQIREEYSGTVVACTIMYDPPNEGNCVPYPYDFSGYDLIVSAPPCGSPDIISWHNMITGYIAEGVRYAETYNTEGFGLYELGGYTGGVWYEPIPSELQVTLDQADQIMQAGIAEANGKVTAVFPHISTGWVDFGTPAYQSLSEWYLSMGAAIINPTEKIWTYDELIEIEETLAGDDYESIFKIEGPYAWE